MNKVIGLFVAAFLSGSGAVFAQSEMEAYKLSQNDLSGTARYLGMGGAFGALGGDISAMSTNPAGLGIYRSSEIVTTVSLSSVKAKTDWLGTKMDQNHTKFSFDNIGYVGYFPTGNEEGLVSWNVGFAYNKVKNFNRQYKMGRGEGGYSLSDYMAAVTNRSGVTGNDLAITESYDPFLTQNWLSVLGYEVYMINSDNPSKGGNFYSSFGEKGADGQWHNWPVQQADMTVNEKGSIDKYDFSFATNISNTLFLGATFSVSDLSYHLSSTYDEDFGFAEGASFSDYLFLDNYVTLDGTGYSFNLGAIVRPVDFLRFGVAYNSPTWYKMTTYYSAEAGTYISDFFAGQPGHENPNLDAFKATPERAYYEYKYRTPDKWIFSAAAIIGQTALISVDYELRNYKSMRLYEWDGVEMADNQFIKDDFKLGGMLKAGAEVKVTPQFAVRIGGAWQNSPAKDHLKDGQVQVLTPGTETAYTVDLHTNYFTVGLGYRFTPNFYADLACVYKMQKENVYPFSNVFDDNGEAVVSSIPATLKTNTTRVAFTLGYKF